MIAIGIYRGHINYIEQVDFINLILGRCVVISSKYGYYTDNHFKILRSVILNRGMVGFNMVYASQVSMRFEEKV